jgi:hypothetical protein
MSSYIYPPVSLFEYCLLNFLHGHFVRSFGFNFIISSTMGQSRRKYIANIYSFRMRQVTYFTGLPSVAEGVRPELTDVQARTTSIASAIQPHSVEPPCDKARHSRSDSPNLANSTGSINARLCTVVPAGIVAGLEFRYK